MKSYTVIIEKGATSYGAYVPDLPGCVASAETKEEVLRLISESTITPISIHETVKSE
jgi:predicted RNase H-like HicB family nuclease